MTSLCTAFGALPLMLASGAGAESRQSIGVVVFYGVVISVVLTLGVVPAVYTLVARNTGTPRGDRTRTRSACARRPPRIRRRKRRNAIVC